MSRASGLINGISLTRGLLLLTVGMLATGCVAPPVPRDAELRELAVQYIERGLLYPDNPVVRAQAIEAAGDVLGSEARLGIREGLNDDHPGVRFAACMALGKLQDAASRDRLRALAEDPDPSVRVGAYFALERLGDTSFRRQWRDMLRGHEDPEVRRNAALALGHLEDPAVRPLLWAAAISDRDDGVRLQSLEALAVLGDPDAINRFIHDAYGGVGFKQPFALQALGRVADARAISALRSRLETAPHLTSRLIAARGLGMHGHDDGYDMAVDALSWSDPQTDLPDDPPENQIMRIRSLAALALGAIGDRRALGWLKVRMEDPGDPRVQLAAATAVLMILDKMP